MLMNNFMVSRDKASTRYALMENQPDEYSLSVTVDKEDLKHIQVIPEIPPGKYGFLGSEGELSWVNGVPYALSPFVEKKISASQVNLK